MSIVFFFSIKKDKKKAARINDGAFKPGLESVLKNVSLGIRRFCIYLAINSH